ncbi:MAG: hypothetical protein FJZ56_00650 [Chlamydiae bacterium]|nr:hypothetical protein [Chlamydiota bacterium]
MARQGYTIQELEDMWRNHVVEISVGAILGLSAVFSLIWGGAMLLWSVFLCMGLGIVGVVFPDQARNITGKFFGFLAAKETVPMIITLAVGGVLSIFAPCLIFALVGVTAGSTIHFDAYSKAIPAASKKMESKKDNDSHHKKAS